MSPGLRRVSVTVPLPRAEQARALMLELFPAGFEEVDDATGVQLIAYTDAGGEERLWAAFGGATGTDVEDGWEDRWRAFHRPVQIGPLWVGPPWEAVPAGALAVVIDPGRAFGTGAHPTTRLCLELLLDVEPGSLVDVGCGSGVLAIAAAKLGFGPVVAVDFDPAAVEATAANARANGVEVDVRLLDATGVARLPAAETAVANITIEAVAAVAARLDSARLVCSGYLAYERPCPPGFQRARRREAGGWAADVLLRGQGAGGDPSDADVLVRGQGAGGDPSDADVLLRGQGSGGDPSDADVLIRAQGAGSDPSDADVLVRGQGSGGDPSDDVLVRPSVPEGRAPRR